MEIALYGDLNTAFVRKRLSQNLTNKSQYQITFS